MHSICHTGDIFGSQRCDCGYQLHESMKMIVEHGCGALFYLADHEGRGIGLFSKSLAYLLQKKHMTRWKQIMRSVLKTIQDLMMMRFVYYKHFE